MHAVIETQATCSMEQHSMGSEWTKQQVSASPGFSSEGTEPNAKALQLHPIQYEHHWLPDLLMQSLAQAFLIFQKQTVAPAFSKNNICHLA